MTTVSIWWALPSWLGPMLKMEFHHLTFCTSTTDDSYQLTHIYVRHSWWGINIDVRRCCAICFCVAVDERGSSNFCRATRSRFIKLQAFVTTIFICQSRVVLEKTEIKSRFTKVHAFTMAFCSIPESRLVLVKTGTLPRFTKVLAFVTTFFIYQ